MGELRGGAGGLAGQGRGAGGAGREVFKETGDGGRCGALLRGGTFSVVTRGNSMATTQATSLTPSSVGLWRLQVVSASLVRYKSPDDSKSVSRHHVID